jgi:serine/threonine protein kinase
VTLDVVTRAVALEPPATGAEPQAISFERRLKGLCALDHPGIVPVLDGRLTAEHHFCLVMQYVPGPTLEWGAPGRWGAGEIARAFDRICEALSFAHDRSVAHGALGPSSVVLPAGRDDADPVLTGWAPWVGPGAAKEDVEGLARLLSALVHGRPVAFRLESVLREAASFSSVGSLRRAAGPILQQ